MTLEYRINVPPLIDFGKILQPPAFIQYFIDFWKNQTTVNMILNKIQKKSYEVYSTDPEFMSKCISNHHCLHKYVFN